MRFSYRSILFLFSCVLLWSPGNADAQRRIRYHSVDRSHVLNSGVRNKAIVKFLKHTPRLVLPHIAPMQGALLTGVQVTNLSRTRWKLNAFLQSTGGVFGKTAEIVVKGKTLDKLRGMILSEKRAEKSPDSEGDLLKEKKKTP